MTAERYGFGMQLRPDPKTQVTVRISAEAVAFIDELVASGEVTSRAAFLDQAAERQRRHILGLRDLEILAAIGDDDPDDLNGLARWNQAQPRDDLG